MLADLNGLRDQFPEESRPATKDLSTIGHYYHTWRLQLNVAKTAVGSFHFNNQIEKRELQVAKYLGVTLYRTLSYKEQLKEPAAKLRTRNNVTKRLCSTT